MAYPDIAAVDWFDARRDSGPGLSAHVRRGHRLLQLYVSGQRRVMGDRMADYVDAGRQVILEKSPTGFTGGTYPWYISEADSDARLQPFCSAGKSLQHVVSGCLSGDIR